MFADDDRLSLDLIIWPMCFCYSIPENLLASFLCHWNPKKWDWSEAVPVHKLTGKPAIISEMLAEVQDLWARDFITQNKNRLKKIRIFCEVPQVHNSICWYRIDRHQVCTVDFLKAPLRLENSNILWWMLIIHAFYSKTKHCLIAVCKRATSFHFLPSLFTNILEKTVNTSIKTYSEM